MERPHSPRAHLVVAPDRQEAWYREPLVPSGPYLRAGAVVELRLRTGDRRGDPGIQDLHRVNHVDRQHLHPTDPKPGELLVAFAESSVPFPRTGRPHVLEPGVLSGEERSSVGRKASQVQQRPHLGQPHRRAEQRQARERPGGSNRRFERDTTAVAVSQEVEGARDPEDPSDRVHLVDGVPERTVGTSAGSFGTTATERVVEDHPVAERGEIGDGAKIVVTQSGATGNDEDGSAVVEPPGFVVQTVVGDAGESRRPVREHGTAPANRRLRPPEIRVARDGLAPANEDRRRRVGRPGGGPTRGSPRS